MADLVLTSDLTTSKFGDERLHFQHKRQRADFIHYDSKDWKEAVTNFTEEERTEARLRNGTWDVSAWPNNNTDAKAMLESEIT